MNRFDFESNEPWDRLRQYRDLISGSFGGTQRTEGAGPRSSLGSGMLGGGAVGFGAGSLLSGTGFDLGFGGMSSGLVGGLGGGILGGLL